MNPVERWFRAWVFMVGGLVWLWFFGWRDLTPLQVIEKNRKVFDGLARK